MMKFKHLGSQSTSSLHFYLGRPSLKRGSAKSEDSKTKARLDRELHAEQEGVLQLRLEWNFRKVLLN